MVNCKGRPVRNATVELKGCVDPVDTPGGSHLLEHEDEMMRPWCVGNPGYTNPKTGRPMCEPDATRP
uniref:Uncharacterized protein n=1 Tax=Tetradesmus obliquus TaxID=3088 RepID=A0A383WPG8_TETOB|eukprot:jgi/Sobl393_1/8925/SZX79335.1